MITHVFYSAARQLHIMRQKPLYHIIAQLATEYSAEIVVTNVRKW